MQIEVLDVNDNAPALPPVVEFGVEENKDPSKYPYVGKLEAADPDAGDNGRVEYALADPEGSALFQVGHSSGELHLKRALDREQTPVHEFRVVASDNGTVPLRSTPLYITLLDALGFHRRNLYAQALRSSPRRRLCESACAT